MSCYEFRRMSDAAPCANGHEWSNQFGDDWTPERGALCDCRRKRWGIAGVICRTCGNVERDAAYTARDQALRDLDEAKDEQARLRQVAKAALAREGAAGMTPIRPARQARRRQVKR